MPSAWSARCRPGRWCTWMPATTTSRAGKCWPNAGWPPRSPPVGCRHPSRSAAGGWSSAPMSGATSTASCAGAPSAAGWWWRSGWRWQAPSSWLAGCCAAPGPTTAGRVALVAAHDRHLVQALTRTKPSSGSRQLRGFPPGGSWRRLDVADAGGEHADQVVVGGVEVFWQEEGAGALRGREAGGGGPKAARGVDGGRPVQAVAAQDGQDHLQQAAGCRGQLRVRREGLREGGVPVGGLEHVLAVGPHPRPQRLIPAAAHDGFGEPLGELADHADGDLVAQVGQAAYVLVQRGGGHAGVGG